MKLFTALLLPACSCPDPARTVARVINIGLVEGRRKDGDPPLRHRPTQSISPAAGYFTENPCATSGGTVKTRRWPAFGQPMSPVSSPALFASSYIMCLPGVRPLTRRSPSFPQHCHHPSSTRTSTKSSNQIPGCQGTAESLLGDAGTHTGGCCLIFVATAAPPLLWCGNFGNERWYPSSGTRRGGPASGTASGHHGHNTLSRQTRSGHHQRPRHCETTLGP